MSLAEGQTSDPPAENGTKDEQSEYDVKDPGVAWYIWLLVTLGCGLGFLAVFLIVKKCIFKNDTDYEHA